MPVYPPSWVPVLKTGDYPHMSRHDAVIWERFLDQFGGNFTAVAYDVALGGFLLDERLGTEAERLGWQYSTALKVDAILQRETEWWIVEVKPLGWVSAVGAALVYTLVAEREGFSPFPLVPVVLTDHMSDDVKYAAEALGIVVVEVPEPAPTPAEEATP